MTRQLDSFLKWRAVLGMALAALVATGVASSVAADTEVVLAGYGGTLERFTRGDLIPAFEKATGIKVTYVVGTAMGNFAKVQASRKNPEIDVYWSNELTHLSGKLQGLYEKLDPTIVTNLDQVFDLARDEDGVGVVSGVNSTGIMYNIKSLNEAGVPPPKSWKELWDPRYKGRLALYNFNIAYSQDLLVIIARLFGGDEDNVMPGLEQLKALRESGNIATFVSTPAELDNMMAQGSTWLCVNGGIRALVQASKGAPIGYVYPEEGAGFFANYFDVVKGAPHPTAAQKLVNFLIGEEAQGYIARGMFVAPINRNVKLSDELAAQLPYGDEKLKRLIRIDREKMNVNLEKWAELWNREVMAAR